MRKVQRKILSFFLVLSMIFPMLGSGNAYANQYKYHIKLNPNGIVSPKATTNPFTIKEGEKINVGVMVADDSGFEITDTDEEFGDESPRYTNVLWEIENGADGITLGRNKGLINNVTAVKEGTYHINLTYQNDTKGEFEPLRLEVNVTPNADAKSKITRIEAVNPPTKVRVGETARVLIKGYNVDNEEVKPSLTTSVVGGSFVSATIVDEEYVLLTGKGEGNATITVKDASGEKTAFSVEGYDDRLWNFDVAKQTLNGFRKKENNPTEVVIPAEIDGVPVKHIGASAFRYSTYANSSKLANPITSLTLPEGLISTGNMSFQGNNIERITIPASLQTLGERTFWGNENLSDVEFKPDGKVTSIGAGAFYKTAIENITLPTYITQIGAEAFKETKIKSITLHEGITNIGGQAFALDSIEEITLPSTLTTINLNSRNRSDSGLFFRTFVDSKATPQVLRFTKVFDKSGIANSENTRGVVNPVAVELIFQDKDGQEIKPSETVVGHQKNHIKEVEGNYGIKRATLVEGDYSYLKDYLNPYNVVDVYTKTEFTNKIIGENYFSENNNYSFKAPFIAGYKAPENVEKLITKEDNRVIFIYQDAEKYRLSLEGDGLTSDYPDVVEGRELNFKIHVPSEKELDSFVITNEKDGTEIRLTKDELGFNGIDYTYQYNGTGNTKAVVNYVDSDVTNDLIFDFGKESIKLGNKLTFDPMYRGKSIPLNKLDVVVTEGIKYQIDEKEKMILPMDAGKINISIALKDYPETRVERTVDVEAVNLIVRMEDDKKTVMEPTAVAVDKLYLTAGESYYENLEFDHVAPILAIEKALKTKGVNTGLKDEFDSSANGNFMLLLGKNMWENINPNGSYMYYVNNKYANKGVADYTVEENDVIYVYYDPNWMVSNAVAYFTEENFNILEGDIVNFNIMGSTYDMYTDKTVVAPIIDAPLEITKDGEKTITENRTDSEGNISHSFIEPGIYYISAVSKNTPAEFTRPKAKVVVIKKKVMGRVLENKDKDVKVTFPEEIDLRDLELVVEKVEKVYRKLEQGKYETRNIFIRNKVTNKEISVAEVTNNGTINVQIEPDVSLLQENAVKLFVEEDGNLVEKNANIDTEKVEFTTEHLSLWTVGLLKVMVVNPPEKTKVIDLTMLTEKEKVDIETAVREANKDFPENTIVEVSDVGVVTVRYPDGQVVEVESEKTVEKKPIADIVEVMAPEKVKAANLNKLTEEERELVKEAIKMANKDLPEISVIEVAENGDVTITYADNSQDTLSSDMVVTKKEADNNDVDNGSNNQDNGSENQDNASQDQGNNSSQDTGKQDNQNQEDNSNDNDEKDKGKEQENKDEASNERNEDNKNDVNEKPIKDRAGKDETKPLNVKKSVQTGDNNKFELAILILVMTILIYSSLVLNKKKIK